MADPREKERSRSILMIKILLFSASIIPAAIVGSMVFAVGWFEWIPFLLVMVGLFLGQAAGDYFYYYFTDFHTTTKDSHTKIFAGWKPLFVDTLMRPKDTLLAGIICLVIDLGILVYFFQRLGFGIVWLAIIGALIQSIDEAISVTVELAVFMRPHIHSSVINSIQSGDVFLLELGRIVISLVNAG